MAEQNQNKSSSSYNSIVIIAVIIIVIGAFFFFGKGDAVKTTSENGENETGSEVMSGLFSVLDQSAGGTVSLSSLKLSELVWVAIYEDVDGTRGNILGAGRFRPEHTEGVVKLLRNTEVGRTYYAVIHKDDGDAIFDHKTDLPFLEAGSEVVKTFTAEAEPKG